MMTAASPSRASTPGCRKRNANSASSLNSTHSLKTFPAGRFSWPWPAWTASTVSPVGVSGTVLEADGLDWPLRLTVLWQRLAGAPLRRTQQGDFFKRDYDRLEGDPLLNSPSDEGLRKDFSWAHTPAIVEWERGDLGPELIEISHEQASKIVEYYRQKWGPQ